MYKEDWQDYERKLLDMGYDENQIAEIKKVRDNYEYCAFEQFQFLFQQKLIKRYIKLRKPRNLFCSDGKFYYLCHRTRRYELVGEFL